MKYTLQVSSKAYSDIQIGIDYYDYQQKGLGTRFHSVVIATMDSIRQMPFAASLAFGNLRYKVTDKFPYLIVYRIEGEIIIVARVFNTYQRPEYLSA